MAKKKALYSQTPAVPAKKIAGTNPVGLVLIGLHGPGMVPEKGGMTRGLVPKNKFHQPKPHGFNHSIRQRSGHLRLSGHEGAHRVGKK